MTRTYPWPNISYSVNRRLTTTIHLFFKAQHCIASMRSIQWWHIRCTYPFEFCSSGHFFVARWTKPRQCAHTNTKKNAKGLKYSIRWKPPIEIRTNAVNKWKRPRRTKSRLQNQRNDHSLRNGVNTDCWDWCVITPWDDMMIWRVQREDIVISDRKQNKTEIEKKEVTMQYELVPRGCHPN